MLFTVKQTIFIIQADLLPDVSTQFRWMQVLNIIFIYIFSIYYLREQKHIAQPPCFLLHEDHHITGLKRHTNSHTSFVLVFSCASLEAAAVSCPCSEREAEGYNLSNLNPTGWPLRRFRVFWGGKMSELAKTRFSTDGSLWDVWLFSRLQLLSLLLTPLWTQTQVNLIWSFKKVMS